MDNQLHRKRLNGTDVLIFLDEAQILLFESSAIPFCISRDVSEETDTTRG